jgi:hypothetical protein
MIHLTEEDLILLYYSEPLANSGHLSECATCRESYAALARTLDACNTWDPPEPDPAFLANLRHKVAPRPTLLPSPTRKGGVPRYAWLAAAVLILSITFFAGRASRKPAAQPAIMAGLSQDARARILAITLADHLDRAELLLTEISNSSDISDDADRARDLVSEGRLLRQSITGPTGDLLDEVERFMLDVANAPDTITAVQLTQWRERINSGSLLFKIRILQSNLRQKEEKL